MKRVTPRFTPLVSCFVAVIGLSGCGLRGYIPKPYHAPPPPPAPIPAPAPAPAPVKAPAPPKAAPVPASNADMVVPDMKPLPPAKKLPQDLGNPMDGS